MGKIQEPGGDDDAPRYCFNHIRRHGYIRKSSPDPFGSCQLPVLYFVALLPLASASTFFHSRSALSSAWMLVCGLRAFFSVCRVVA